jgi:hypothetical protein
MFGKAKDAAAAAAVAALSLFAVLLPGLMWTSVLLLVGHEAVGALFAKARNVSR